MDIVEASEKHYSVGGIMTAILEALKTKGKDLGALTPGDLSPVDAFHTRGNASTVELAGLIRPRKGMEILDVGCGIGGSARHLAVKHGCVVAGLDLSPEYIEVARELTELVGLSETVSFKQGSALDLPFGDASFDGVWTEHVQMNIDDKERFYAELNRVLRPGGRMVFHEVFLGEGGEPLYPVPWAEDAGISSMVDGPQARTLMEKQGFGITDWMVMDEPSRKGFAAAHKRIREKGAPPLGLHLLMGESAADKIKNMGQNLREKRITIIQGAAVKR